MKEQKTIDLYKKIKQLIADDFCKKYDLEIEYPLPGEAGYMIADYYISIEDMITCLEENYTFEQFLSWYDYALDIHMYNSNQDSKKKDEPIINLKNYVNHGEQLINNN